ncbi:hypothetical protein GGF46_001700 [Coemansia sp. RSA 552]|nr:hypothetical protein GGF46_001700 [Coemansia sp. RSA 552]
MAITSVVLRYLHALSPLISQRHVLAKLGVWLLGSYTLGRTLYRFTNVLLYGPLSHLPGTTLSKVTMVQVKFSAIVGGLHYKTEADCRKYGDIYRIGPKSVVISNPADCKRVLGSHKFRKSRIYQNFAVVADTTFSTRSAELTHLRRKQIGPAFTHGHLRDMEPTILETGYLSLRNKWDNAIRRGGGEAQVNYCVHFLCTSFDIITALGYGEHFYALRDDRSKIMDWVQHTTQLCSLRLFFKNLAAFPLSLYTEPLIRSVEDLTKFSNTAIDKRHALLQIPGINKPKDILQALIDAKDSHIKMTRNQITAENILFLIAGTDTTAMTLTWTLHYLLLHPDIHERAVKSARGKFAHSHVITYAEAKAQLPLIEAIIYESLRIQAVSSTPLPRVVPPEGATFQGHFLPGGTQINVNIGGANHHQPTWHQPHKFIPERFLQDDKAKQNVLTFSSGVRICPGRNLAHYEMLTILANTLKNYDIRLPKDSLFVPARRDENGCPVVMPRNYNVTVGPRFPARDCRIVIRPAPLY